MASLPSPPFVSVDGIANFRDVGGYAISKPPASSSSASWRDQPSTPPPVSVRRHYLYRCADTSQITASGRATIRALGITTLFDLRSRPEIEKNAATRPVPVIEGVQRREVPAFGDEDYSPEAVAVRYREYAGGGVEGFTRAYADILSHAGPAYRTILLHILHQPASPCIIHCSAGKDRTGLIIAIILSLAGVGDDLVADEYALTEQGLGALKERIVSHLLENPVMRGDRDGAVRMVSARKENMLATLQMMKEKYGGAEGYVKQVCGFGDAEIASIRANLTPGEGAVLP